MLRSEEDMIRAMIALLPRGASQLNAPFEADAEIVRWNGRNLLVSTDEFSAEDCLDERDPRRLGWNIAAGAVTDILATGGTPLFYLHSLVAADGWDEAYVGEMARGCAALLGVFGISFLGGDFGRSEVWRCAATVIGEATRPLLRSGARPGDGLYVTGEIGGGNLEAMLKMMPREAAADAATRDFGFEIAARKDAARIIARHASACIDTSDGLYLALRAMAGASGVGFSLGEIPYAEGVSVAARAARLPVELFFLCEAGEYELLAAVPRERCAAFEDELEEAGEPVHMVGVVRGGGVMELRIGTSSVDLGGPVVRARDHACRRNYVEEIAKWLETRSARGGS